MSAIQYMQPIAPIAALFSRLNRDAAAADETAAPPTPAGMLFGLKVRRAQIDWQTLGADDLPCIGPDDFEFRDSIFAGAKARPTDTGSVNLKMAAQLNFLLAVNRDHGLFAADSGKAKGLMDWLTLICDSLELNDAVEADANLDGTCIEPLLLEASNFASVDLCHFIVLTVHYYPHAFERGTRRDMMNLPFIPAPRAALTAPAN